MAVSRSKQRSRTSRGLSRSATGQNHERPLIAEDPYEVKYLHKRFPRKTYREVMTAYEQCKDEIKTEDRKQIMDCMKKRLGPPRG